MATNQQCSFCGKGFSGYSAMAQFCSPSCYNAFRVERAAKIRATTKVCKVCGVEFGPREGRSLSEFATRQYCDKECAGKRHRNTIEDLLKKIVINHRTGCHIWVGTTTHNGYGTARLDNRWVMVHRAIWEHHNGPIPGGLQIDHTCMVRNCCNVDHLRVVTNRVNILASNNACAVHLRKPFCPTCGGEYTIRPNGQRYCKPCHLRWNAPYLRRYRAKKRKAEGFVDKRFSSACRVCGGPYSIWPNGKKYCQPCHKRRCRETYLKYLAKKENES
jgi:HNH endonuclease